MKIVRKFNKTETKCLKKKSLKYYVSQEGKKKKKKKTDDQLQPWKRE